MNREKLKQLTIKSWKEDAAEHDFMDCSRLKVDNFFCEKMGKDIKCTLTFKDSAKIFGLTVTPSVSYWDEVK